MITPPSTPCEFCQGPVIMAVMSGQLKPYDAEPSPDGNYIFTEAIIEGRVRAQRVNTINQFGRQGRLHRLHSCAQMKRWQKRR